MKREETNKNIDKEIYKRTASKSKVVNIGRIHFRGGTRL